MEEKKTIHWRRWVLLALMIVGFIAAGVLPPVSPEITVAPEKLIEQPVFTLPVIGPIYLVNTLPPLFVAVVLIAILAYFTNRSMKRSSETDLVPRGVGNAMEAIFEMIYNLTESSAGAKWASRIFPWFATILFYVLMVNLIRLIPGFESVGILRHATGEGFGTAQLGASNWFFQVPPKVESGGFVLVPFARGPSLDLNFTFALAAVSVVMTQVIGFRALGVGYLSKFFNFTTMFKMPFFGAMDFLVGLLELISELAKILSFAFRLFFNMFAGMILVAVVAVLLARLTIVSGMLYMFELFVGLIQAFVFGMLTMVFMSNAIKGHGHEEEHAPAGAEAHEI
ncbi:MAG TPA: F0F1 ATP synthase subunit A [Anaerolineales bacterium]|nr:F0F1 ATP synthase subunit A [Anaerolineales bacterium]